MERESGLSEAGRSTATGMAGQGIQQGKDTGRGLQNIGEYGAAGQLGAAGAYAGALGSLGNIYQDYQGGGGDRSYGGQSMDYMGNPMTSADGGTGLNKQWDDY